METNFINSNRSKKGKDETEIKAGVNFANKTDAKTKVNNSLQNLY